MSATIVLDGVSLAVVIIATGLSVIGNLLLCVEVVRLRARISELRELTLKFAADANDDEDGPRRPPSSPAAPGSNDAVER